MGVATGAGLGSVGMGVGAPLVEGAVSLSAGTVPVGVTVAVIPCVPLTVCVPVIVSDSVGVGDGVVVAVG